MTHEEAVGILRDQIITLSGLDAQNVRRGPVDAPGPDESVFVLLVLADLGRGRPSRTGTTQTQARTADVLVSAYGQSAVEALHLVAMGIWGDDPDGMAALAEGVTLNGVSPVSTNAAVVRTAHEPRASLTITIGYISTRTVTEPPAAESVTGVLHANDLDPMTIFTEVIP